MFQIEHPIDYLDRVDQERVRVERRNSLVRALRGATPPFSEATEEQLRAVMGEEMRAQMEPGR